MRSSHCIRRTLLLAETPRITLTIYGDEWIKARSSRPSWAWPVGGVLPGVTNLSRLRLLQRALHSRPRPRPQRVRVGARRCNEVIVTDLLADSRPRAHRLGVGVKRAGDGGHA